MSAPSDFDAGLREKSEAVSTDLSSESEVLLVAFGGFAGGMGIPPFEFFRIASELEAKRVFVRDLNQAAYHRDLPGMPGGVDGIVRYLKRVISEHHIRRTVIAGNSLGGYAALLVGSLLGADEVLAFSPYTFIGPVARLLSGDTRVARVAIRALLSRNARWRYFDLAGVYASEENPPECEIYYCDQGTQGRLDALHATRMARFPSIHLHIRNEGGHDLVKHLRDVGELADILRAAMRRPE